MWSGLLALAVHLLACVDPEKDYNDYVNRTVDAHAPPPVSADSGAETGPLYAPDAGFTSNTYFMSCLTGNAEGDPSKASTSVATVTFAPKSGGGGTITFGDRALKIDPTSLADVSGVYYQASPASAPVAPDGSATVTWGNTTIPGDANPVTGMDLVFSSSSMDLQVESETQICGNFSGNLIQPLQTLVTGPCVFRLLPSATAPIPQLQLGDFHCP
ncbi:MAG TPA: hypothetical protein VMI75_18825 [Polyangiaceae bacterium]|nr:hypothetical protein [Polyangiaceae bacterium]